MVNVRLLLVDDEPALLDLLRRYLERLGYTVDACTDPETAIAHFSAAPGDYSLVLTDLTLEGMNGEELIRRLRALNPAIPAILSSGYPHRPESPKTFFLQKPYIPKVLAEAIEKSLRP